MDSLTKGLAAFATVCGVIVMAAAIDMLAFGNPTAINALIGAGVPGAAFGVAAVHHQRSTRRAELRRERS